MKSIKNLIVGAGPAGLAAAAWLTKLGLPYQIWESSDQLAHRWRNHYQRLHLHTVKEFSHLPFKPFPDHYPTFVSREQMVEYCENYACTFDIRPEFGKKLVLIERENEAWRVTEESGEKVLVHNLIVATGLNSKPVMPDWPGLDDFKGEVIHSRDYREPAPFKGKHCLVVGMGNTGAEIALDLAENEVETAVSVRSPLNVVPRVAFGRPTQATALALRKLPYWLQDILGNLMKAITIGKLDRYGIKSTRISPLKQLRTTGKTPLIDLGTVKMIKEGRIAILPDIKALNSDTLSFVDGQTRAFDVIICATGYRSMIGSLLPELKSYLDPYGNPKFNIGSGKWSGLYFLGFDNYRAGGILGIIRDDSEKIARHVLHYRTALKDVL